MDLLSMEVRWDIVCRRWEFYDLFTEKNKPQLISVLIENNEDVYLARITGIQGALGEGNTSQDAILIVLMF